jgi:oxazoline/thiazoline synthase
MQAIDRKPFVVVCDSFDSAALASLLGEVSPSYRQILLIWPVRRGVFIGPRLRPGWRPCVDCLLMWVGLDRRVCAGTPCLSWRHVEILSREIPKWRQRPSAYTGRIKEILFAKDCPHWYDIAAKYDCNICGAKERPSLRQLSNPITGIVSSLTSSVFSGIWLASAEVSTPNTPASPRLRILASGVGCSRAEATLKCLYESIERYSLITQGNERYIEATVDELGESVASSTLLYPFSDRQYLERDQWNLHHHGIPYIPERLPRHVKIRWSRCWSAVNGQAAWIPSDMVYFARDYGSQHRYYICDSSGCAAAPSDAHAVLNATLELIERDAIALWWYNRLIRPAIQVDLTVPRYSRWNQYFASIRRSYCLLNITTDLEVPVVAGVSWDHRGRRPALGFGCHPSLAIAAEKALRELCQTTKGAISGQSRHYPRASPEYTFIRWVETTRIFDHPYLIPNGISGSGFFGAMHSEAPEELLRLILNRLQVYGLKLWIVPVTRPELGIPTIRILCGELCHAGHRLGHSRLYNLPVRLKWLSQQRSELDMNPTPCIF